MGHELKNAANTMPTTGTQLLGPKQLPQLTIVRVENGYTITPPYYGGEAKVAHLLNEMLDIVKDYFEDKPGDSGVR